MATDTVTISGMYRTRLVEELSGTRMFALAVRKCSCANFLQLHVFDKQFLKFKHLKELYPEHVLHFDAATQLPIPVDEWAEKLVAPTLSAINIRPHTGIDDILCYRLFLCCCNQQCRGLLDKKKLVMAALAEAVRGLDMSSTLPPLDVVISEYRAIGNIIGQLVEDLNLVDDDDVLDKFASIICGALTTIFRDVTFCLSVLTDFTDIKDVRTIMTDENQLWKSVSQTYVKPVYIDRMTCSIQNQIIDMEAQPNDAATRSIRRLVIKAFNLFILMRAMKPPLRIIAPPLYAPLSDDVMAMLSPNIRSIYLPAVIDFDKSCVQQALGFVNSKPRKPRK